MSDQRIQFEEKKLSEVRKVVSQKRKRKSALEMALEIVREDITPFRNEQEETWADIKLSQNVRATWRVRRLASYVRKKFYETTGAILHKSQLDEVLEQIDGLAMAGPVIRTCLRVYYEAGRILLDLCDDQWRLVEVTPEGWRIRHGAEVEEIRFVRDQKMQPLPEPKHPEDPKAVWARFSELFHLDEQQTIIAVAWLLGTLGPKPYPILAVSGCSGSGKSTFVKHLRAIVDPSYREKQRPPKDERDLFVAARNSFVLSFDNVSHIPDELSDAICSLTTDGSFTTRKLFTDSDEAWLKGTRPILLNGIPTVGKNTDLRDRMLHIVFTKNLEDYSLIKTESEVEREFEQLRPYLLGALLDSASVALHNYETTPTPKHRMADFARWVVSAEKGGAVPWKEGQFMEVVKEQKVGGARQALEDDPVAVGILKIIESRAFEGTAKDLLEEIKNNVPENQRGKHFPSRANDLGTYLRRIQPDLLRGYGIEVEFDRMGKDRKRIIRINKRNNIMSSALSALSTPRQNEAEMADNESASVVRLVVRPEAQEKQGCETPADKADNADNNNSTLRFSVGKPADPTKIEVVPL